MVARDNSAATHQLKSSPVARICVGLAIVGASAVLLFARLGHYALWDDEATIGLSGIGVWRTGDTTAVIGHNIVAYRGGAELRNLHFRYIPPLPSYLAAPFVGLMGNSSLPARLPFAILGMTCVILMVWWLWKDRADPLTWVLLGLATIGNVSLFLYFRQARYYGLAIAASVGLTYLYLRWDGRRRSLVLFALVSLCLLASNYLNYVALYVCLAVDYLLWGRKQRPLQWRDWLTIFLPQLLIGTPLLLTWNPLAVNVIQYQAENIVADKMILLWWTLRDLDQNEFGVTMLLLLVPVAYLLVREKWLLRGALALLVYILAITLFSPQAVGLSSVADVRYFAPLLPLSIFLGAAAVRRISFGKWWLALPLAVVAFGTDLLQLYPYYTREFRSTISLYVRELLDPPGDPYKEAAKWINANVHEGRSIWVEPDFMTYPLMYHAPKVVYAWQLANPPDAQFAGLDPIHFQGAVPPDYVIAFGPAVQEVAKFLRDGEAAGIEYKRSDTLDIFWRDLYRPEVAWRSFEPVTAFDRKSEAIYIFQRVRPPVRPTNKTG